MGWSTHTTCYAVLQCNAHTAHAFIRKAIADLTKPNSPPTLGLIAVPIDALSTSIALLSHPAVFLAGIHQPDPATLPARHAFIHEPLNCCNPPRSDQTHLVLTISNPPGVEAFAEGRLTNLQCVAHATHQHASRADKVVARRNPDKASLHATIDNNLLRERNGPSADDRTPDVEPITSAASARATTTLTALFAAVTDQAHLIAPAHPPVQSPWAADTATPTPRPGLRYPTDNPAAALHTHLHGWIPSHSCRRLR